MCPNKEKPMFSAFTLSKCQSISTIFIPKVFQRQGKKDWGDGYMVEDTQSKKVKKHCVQQKTNEAHFQVTFCPEHPLQNKQPCHHLTLEVNPGRPITFSISSFSRSTHFPLKIGNALFKDDQRRTCFFLSFKNMFYLQVPSSHSASPSTAVGTLLVKSLTWIVREESGSFIDIASTPLGIMQGVPLSHIAQGGLIKVSIGLTFSFLSRFPH